MPEQDINTVVVITASGVILVTVLPDAVVGRLYVFFLDYLRKRNRDVLVSLLPLIVIIQPRCHSRSGQRRSNIAFLTYTDA
jgi:hypothetical protein